VSTYAAPLGRKPGAPQSRNPKIKNLKPPKIRPFLCRNPSKNTILGGAIFGGGKWDRFRLFWHADRPVAPSAAKVIRIFLIFAYFLFKKMLRAHPPMEFAQTLPKLLKCVKFEGKNTAGAQKSRKTKLKTVFFFFFLQKLQLLAPPA